MARGLSHLPVTEGHAAEVLNREIVPYLRDLDSRLVDLEARVTDVEARLDALAVNVRQIADFLGLP